MANIFVDTNILFDLAVRNKKRAKELVGHKLFISPLSFHIYSYSQDIKIPDKKTSEIYDFFEIVSFTSKILEQALKGPTPDLEDNIQLHSAVKAECDYFLTNDKKILKMKFFGKTKIVSSF